jgi:hypothetical protein
MSALDDLLNEIFDGTRPPFYPEFAEWVRGSRRFRAFATSYRGKIRSRLRNIRDEGGLKDLRAELETAFVLLREERFTLEYERYAASKQRGPDFTVMFKTHTPFNIEVRRIRSREWDDDADARLTKLMAVLCDKVGQMPPGIVNMLWLITEREISEAELIRAVTTLRQLAEHKTEEFFTKRGFESAAEFIRQFQRLSGVILRQPDKSVIWMNALAHHKPPPEIVTALQKL